MLHRAESIMIYERASNASHPDNVDVVVSDFQFNIILEMQMGLSSCARIAVLSRDSNVPP